MSVNHFDYVRRDNFHLRYLTYEAFAVDMHAPVLVYVGNEAPIESFYNNTGAMFEAAKALQAHMVFLEHRYYGKSLPYGPRESFTASGLEFLTVEQALADLTSFVQQLPALVGCKGRVMSLEFSGTALCDVVLYGGSYGGMLAAWHRFKYPHMTLGAIASGAPVDFYRHQDVQGRFRKAYLSTFESASPGCAMQVETLLGKLVHASSRELKAANFRTCSPVKTAEDIERLLFYVEGALGSLCMLDYPYPQQFVAPLPANPVKQACKLLGAHDSLAGLHDAVDLLVNGTGTMQCYDIAAELVGERTTSNWEFTFGQQSPGSSLGAEAWNYQACTEMPFQPMSSDGFGFFPPNDNQQLQQIMSHCSEKYGVDTRPDWLPMSFGYGPEMVAHLTNVFFAENMKDPWHIGTDLLGTLPTQRGLHRRIAPGGAHHQELRFTAQEDDDSVKQLRAAELQVVSEWLQCCEKAGLPGQLTLNI